MKLYETMHALHICCWPLVILDGDKIVHIISKRIHSSKSCFTVHMQGVFCKRIQNSQVLWVPLMVRTINLNVCSSGSFRSRTVWTWSWRPCCKQSSHLPANHRPIAGGLDTDLQYSQSTGKQGETEREGEGERESACVCAFLCGESFASTLLLTSRVRQFGVPSSSMSGYGVADPAELSSSITPPVSPNQNQHIVCLSLYSAAMLVSKSALLPEIALWAAGWRTY